MNEQLYNLVLDLHGEIKGIAPHHLPSAALDQSCKNDANLFEIIGKP